MGTPARPPDSQPQGLEMGRGGGGGGLKSSGPLPQGQSHSASSGASSHILTPAWPWPGPPLHGQPGQGTTERPSALSSHGGSMALMEATCRK